jgi:hypothetical protein
VIRRVWLVVELDPRIQPAAGGHPAAVAGVWAARVLATGAKPALVEVIADRLDAHAGTYGGDALRTSRGPDETWCATFGGDPRVWIAMPTHVEHRGAP